jgi:hypothetical protein
VINKILDFSEKSLTWLIDVYMIDSREMPKEGGKLKEEKKK